HYLMLARISEWKYLLGNVLAQADMAVAELTAVCGQTYVRHAGWPQMVVSADFNGDGVIDLAVITTSNKTVLILLGYGDGTFKPAASWEGIWGGDRRSQRRWQAGVGHRDDYDHAILLKKGDGTFQTGTTVNSFVAGGIGDFNGDGKPDLVSASGPGGGWGFRC